MSECVCGQQGMKEEVVAGHNSKKGKKRKYSSLSLFVKSIFSPSLYYLPEQKENICLPFPLNRTALRVRVRDTVWFWGNSNQSNWPHAYILISKSFNCGLNLLLGTEHRFAIGAINAREWWRLRKIHQAGIVPDQLLPPRSRMWRWRRHLLVRLSERVVCRR